jgi:predicted metalloprotease
MRLDDQRRSDNVEDRRGMRAGRGGGMTGGLPFGVRGLGLGGIILIGLLLLVLPSGLRNAIIGQVMGGGGGASVSGGQSPAAAAGPSCADGDAACDFARGVLGSTEDVWNAVFASGALPRYGQLPATYEMPRLVLFEGRVDTGCGSAGSDVGPFYCPADHQLYIDPSFYDVMARRLNAPGDFAQAYVVAHEVGHHVQNLIGSMQAGPRESQNQHQVRVELQADCFAGVWGNQARARLQIRDEDLREAMNAAHAIGDDTLQTQGRGYADPDSFTHGTSEQRMRWFKRGFDSGDARQCDTFQGTYDAL